MITDSPMRRLFLFNPENDLALARNLAHYTPPPAAARLKYSGETLPLWYGGANDCFMHSGVNGAWLDRMQSTFDLRTTPYDYHPEGLTPSPWGWSLATRHEFWNIGFDYSTLPSEDAIERMRQLSHRRTAAEVTKRLISAGIELAQPAVELCSEEVLKEFLDASKTDIIFKQPWSSSGRGLIPYSPSERTSKFGQLKGIIKKYGSVMAEPRHNRRSDFAILYNMEGGVAEYRGLSLFTTDANGSYLANILMPQQAIGELLAAECGVPSLSPIAKALSAALTDVVGTAYSGPLGVDFMTLNDHQAPALCEINLRNTMGHVSLELYSRHIEQGRKGEFRITPRDSSSAERRTIEPLVRNGRLCQGTLFLNQPGSFFDFTATL